MERMAEEFKIDSTLPKFLRESIKAFLIGQEKYERGGYYQFDMDYCDLQSDINVCEVEQMITSDEAWELRERYLGLCKSKYHEINDMIKIDFKIPEALRYLMEEAEEADIRNDGSYDNLADTIDVMSKNCYAAGKITAAQWDIIVKRYPQ